MASKSQLASLTHILVSGIRQAQACEAVDKELLCQLDRLYQILSEKAPGFNRGDESSPCTQGLDESALNQLRPA